jgi:hypothetical protein
VKKSAGGAVTVGNSPAEVNVGETESTSGVEVEAGEASTGIGVWVGVGVVQAVVIIILIDTIMVKTLFISKAPFEFR